MSEISAATPESSGNSSRRPKGWSWLAGWGPEILVVLAFLLVQANGVRNGGYAGQDYDIHTQWLQEAADHPWRFLTENQSKALGRTNPPLYHLLAAAAAAVGPLSREQNVGVFNLLLGLGGLLLFMATARMWIRNTAVRAAFTLLLAFLPVFCIHNLVMAADVLTMPAGGMILLGLGKLLAHQGRAWRSGIALLAAGTALGLLSKFTFSTVPVLVLALAGLLSLGRLLARKRMAWLILIGAGAPMLLAGAIWLQFHKTLDSHFKGNPKLGTSFHMRDILGLKAADRDLVEAIPYSRRRELRSRQEDHAPYPEIGKDPGKGRTFSLVEAHRYSYPALLVDAVFTDIMNLRQPGRTGLHFGPRDVRNQGRMDLAIRSGWLLALLALVTTAGTLLSSLRRAWRVRDARSTFIVTALALALALAGPVIVTMLYAYDGYLGGYWLPRLILFPLATTLLACFVWLDRLNRRFAQRLGWPILAVALWQSLLSLSFLVSS